VRYQGNRETCARSGTRVSRSRYRVVVSSCGRSGSRVARRCRLQPLLHPSVLQSEHPFNLRRGDSPPGNPARDRSTTLTSTDRRQRDSAWRLPQLSIAPFCSIYCVTPALGMIPGMRYCCTTTSTTSKIVSTMLCTKVRANTTPSWPFSLVTETPVAIF